MSADTMGLNIGRKGSGMKVERVAYVVRGFPALSETFIAEELAELRRRDIEVRILSLRPPKDEPRHEIVTRAGLLERTSYDREDFARLLEEFQPQLFHAHFAVDSTEVARGFAQNLGVPYCFTAHHFDIFRKPPADFADRAAASGGVVTVSEANVRHIESTFGVPRERMHLIPCGVDMERFRPGGTKAEPPHLVCVARLVPVKNQALLLRAAALLRQKGMSFRCVFVGEGRSRVELEALRAELGLGDTVTLVGANEQNEVIRWWQRATIAVLPSNSEGMPVCLMEAAACGLPVVATAVGGVPEMIDQGRTGILVPPGDTQALADALERLLKDPAERERMGRAAREVAVTRFSVTRQVDRLLGVWTAALEGCM